MKIKDLPLPTEEFLLCETTGKLTRSYRLNGFDCPVVTLEDNLAKRQAGYTLIDLDLDDVKGWLSHAYEIFGPKEIIHDSQHKLITKYVLSSENKSLSIVKALWFSSIVVYAKCFTQAEGRGVKLERDMLSEPMRECHDKIMNYRHTIVAHAGITTLETAPLEIVLSPKSIKGGILLKNNCKRVEFSDDRNEIITFSDLVNAVHEDVKIKRKKITKKIMDRTRSTSPKELYKNARDR